MKKVFALVSFSLLLGIGIICLLIPSEKDIKGCIKTSMFEVDLCPTGKNYVPLKRISSHLQKAIVLTEDSNFYQHEGFDTEGIEHCWEKFKKEKRYVCGGSTITQQLAKNMFLTKDKTVVRKGLEALITVKIEKTLSKKEILERYLNVVQFGKNVFGVKEASQFYFKKSPWNLDVVESAFLAMVLPNPEKYSQSYYRKDLTKFARRRITQIIENMYRYNRITEEAYVTGLARVDSFLVEGHQQAKPVDTPTLSSDDLQEMIQEIEKETPGTMNSTDTQSNHEEAPSEESSN